MTADAQQQQQQWTSNWRPGLRRATPVSNTERQRRFRKRNPGYYQRLHAKRRAEMKACGAAHKAAAAWRAQLNHMPLMLPAPHQVSKPLLDELIRALEAEAAKREAMVHAMPSTPRSSTRVPPATF